LSPELEQALRDLEACAARKRPPGRPVVRALLIAYGKALQAAAPDEDPDHHNARERIARAALRLGRGWDDAVSSELALACGEHVQSVDPRYLHLEDYDLEYTLEARERLEARLRAARELGLELPETMARGVREADRRLIERLGQVPPGWEAPGQGIN
jgi:hypothetical protein